jgi:uncharacterized protein (UPF0332 family)
MDRKFFFISVFVHLFYIASFAQNTPIGHIYNKYLDLNNRIESGSLYLDEFRLNANQLDWNDQFLHQRVERYYYDIYQSQYAFLNIVRVTIDSSGVKYLLEMMFDISGELMLCLEKSIPKTQNYSELRIYFDKGKQILWVEDAVVVNSSTIFHSEKVSHLIRIGKYFWSKFNKRTNIPKK